MTEDMFRNPIFINSILSREVDIETGILISQLSYENPVGIYESGALFYGAEVNALDKSFLQDNNITHILNLGSAEFYPGEFQYKSMTFLDNEDTVLPIEECLNFMKSVLESPSNKLLVHCVEGKSRSGAIITAYFMEKHDWTLSEALSFVRKQRFAIPNGGFIRQLSEYFESRK